MVRVLVAGATGVLGRRVCALLVARDDEVAGITRSAAGASRLVELGVEPLVGDVYDASWLSDVVTSFRPAVIVNELTDLPDDADRLGEHRARNARIRRVGTGNLLAAAAATGAVRVVTQSVAWTIPGDGGRAVEEMERMVLDAGGVVVRYGQLYGPGTYHPSAPPDPPRVHVDAAAARTLPALVGPSRVITIDEGDDRPERLPRVRG
jgi:nucleoside-diphosphate-sugar epimerase